MNFLELAKKYQEDLIKDLQGLLAYESVLIENPNSKEAPFGKGIYDSLNYVLALGEKYGFKIENIDNVAGHIEYGEGDDIIGILVHVDVVPADGEWLYPPFAGTIVNEKIYGRGAVDDKGPTICSLYALRMLKDLNIKLNKRVRLIIGTDEESKWRGISRYFEKCPMPSFGFSPDADFPLIYGEKGILHLEIIDNSKTDITFLGGNRFNVVPHQAIATMNKECNNYEDYLSNNNLKGKYKENEFLLQGKSAHALEPDLGVNAVVKLAKFLSQYTNNNLIKFVNAVLDDSRLKGVSLDFSDYEMGDLTCNLGILKIENDKGKACLDFRYPIRWNKELFLVKFKDLVESYKLELNIVEDKNVHYINKEDPNIKQLHQAYIKYTNDETTPLKTIGGGTYARALAKGVAFGIGFPGREDVVHQANEYIYIEDLITALAIYADAIFQLGR